MTIHARATGLVLHQRRHRLTAAAAVLLVWAGGQALLPLAAQQPSVRFEAFEATIDDIRSALGSGQVTCRDVVQQYLARIEAYNQKGPALNAVVTVNPRALEEADRLDREGRSGTRGPLHCVPVLVKDQFETSDMRTTYGSAVFKDFVPRRNAAVVEKMRAAGAIVIAKATMGEFASGYVGSISGPIRNPYDPRRHASGSSGGVGAGVAASLATVGIGEDTGGSIRGPAAAGSLVGLRPTLPLVSRFGMLPFRPSYDTAGPIARTARDAAIVLDVIAGYDPRDPVTAYAAGQIPSSFAASLPISGLQGVRVGVIRYPLLTDTKTDTDDYRNIHQLIDRALVDLSARGASVVGDVVLPDGAAIIARTYDGNVFEPEPAINGYLAQHPNAPVKTLREILLSGLVLPSRMRGLLGVVGHSTDEPGYLRVQQETESLRRTVLGVMAARRLDVLVYPTGDTSPGPVAPDVMTNPNEGDTRVGSNRTLASVLAFPAVTVPAGFTPDGMPVGLELMGRPFDDGRLLGMAHAYEQATHHRRPPASTPRLAERR